jgi:hypothetical protein
MLDLPKASQSSSSNPEQGAGVIFLSGYGLLLANDNSEIISSLFSTYSLSYGLFSELSDASSGKSVSLSSS